MRTSVRHIAVFLFAILSASCVLAQSNSGTIIGTVTNPSGAVVPSASVSIQNPVSQYLRTAVTDKSGQYQFSNIPFNPYHVTVSASGFASVARDVGVHLEPDKRSSAGHGG
jgi:hypothetical protein